ncbi:hypothetical protein HK405_012112 [Cladochytrium tenue]|nr:hypothetical protein HK405_012112 [Cladochytrium tenue]
MSVFFAPLLLLIDNENRDQARSVGEVLRGVDFGGALTLLVASGAVLLAVTFGATVSWSASQTIAMFVVACVAIIAFVVNEVFWATNPIMPPFHFKSRSVVASSGGTSMAFMMYVPMLYRMSKQATFLMSEVHFIPYNLAWAVLAFPAALLLHFVRPNHVVTAGVGLLALGAGLFASVVGDAIPDDAVGAVYMAIAGAGAALANQNSLYCAQADLRSLSDQAIVGNVPVYFHRIGGTVLQEVMSAIVDHAKATHSTFAGQVQPAFWAATGFACFAFLVSFAIKNTPKISSKAADVDAEVGKATV